MLGQTYYHETIRKYVAVFGTLFNDINIQRKNSSGVVLQQIKVPIAYEAKDKMLLRVRRGSKADQSIGISLPRMGFGLNAIIYDPLRKLSTLGQTYAANNATSSTTLLKQYNPVPYNFEFELSAMVDNSEDGAQIFEQIVPFFTPEFTVSVSLIPSMNIKPDITIILNDVSIDDSYEGDLTVRREILWSLNFTLKGFIYPDVKSGSVVKTVIVHLRTPAEVGESEYIILENSTDFSINHLILDADAGSPNDTSVMKILSEDSFDSSMAGIKTRITTTPGAVDVIASDDFGYSQTVEYFDDTIDNNPTTGLDVNL
jgi:hypothetical protein